MRASPVTSRPLTRPSAAASGTTLGRRPSVSSRQKVSSSGMLPPSRQPKDPPSPTSLRNTIRLRSNFDTKATSMPSSSLSASSARPRVSGVPSEATPEATSESLPSFSASPAWSRCKAVPLFCASPGASLFHSRVSILLKTAPWPLFTRLPRSGILRTSPRGGSRKFATSSKTKDSPYGGYAPPR
jgi:hypothetical protein